MKKIILILMVLVAIQVNAQEKQEAKPKTSIKKTYRSIPPPPPAPVQKKKVVVSKEFEQEVRKMIQNQGAKRNYKLVINQMINSEKILNSDIPDVFYEKMRERMLNETFNQMVDELIPVYAEHLTIDDIRGINAFHETEAGKNLLREQPFILQKTMLIGQKIGMELGEKIAYEVMEEKRLNENQKKNAPNK